MHVAPWTGEEQGTVTYLHHMQKIKWKQNFFPNYWFMRETWWLTIVGMVIRASCSRPCAICKCSSCWIFPLNITYNRIFGSKLYIRAGHNSHLNTMTELKNHHKRKWIHKTQWIYLIKLGPIFITFSARLDQIRTRTIFCHIRCMFRYYRQIFLLSVYAQIKLGSFCHIQCPSRYGRQFLSHSVHVQIWLGSFCHISTCPDMIR